MVEYSTFTNVNGAFPNYTGKNASGAGATDGTPYIASVIDDAWGARQDQMDHAGLSPNGVTEAVGVSQHMESLKKGFNLGAGYTVMYNKEGTPVANGDRLLLLTGQGILRASYTELDLAVYVGDGNNAAVSAGGGAFYRADDAAGTTPNIAGIYLILPDGRGRVPRGLDIGATVDPDGASRVLGDVQADAFQAFQVGSLADSTGARDYWGKGDVRDKKWSAASVAQTDETTMRLRTDSQGAVEKVVAVDDGTNGTPRTSSETRMANFSTNYAITY